MFAYRILHIAYRLSPIAYGVSEAEQADQCATEFSFGHTGATVRRSAAAIK